MPDAPHFASHFPIMPWTPCVLDEVADVVSGFALQLIVALAKLACPHHTGSAGHLRANRDPMTEHAPLE